MIRSLAVAGVAAAVLFGVASATTAAPPTKTTLQGSAPAWARQGNFVRAADPAASGRVPGLPRLELAAPRRSPRPVSDPTSSSYGKYISASEFRRRFAPSAAAGRRGPARGCKARASRSTTRPTNNHYVAAEGTVAQVAGGVRDAVRTCTPSTGRRSARRRATSRSRASIAGDVTGVVGLDDSAAFVQTNHVVDKNAPPSAGFRNAPPLSDFWAQLVSPYAYPDRLHGRRDPATAPWTVKGYTPAQIKGAYGISGLRRRGPDGRDHRRLRVADDPAGRQPVVDQPRAADDERRPVHAGRAARHLQPAAEPAAGSAGLVRRGDARRRSRARHGARGEDRLRRRAEQLPGSRRGDEPRRRSGTSPRS